MKKIDYILLTIILAVAFIFRAGYKLNEPLADLHSWRQADTAAVARNFARDGINLMWPRYDDISKLQSGIENPEGVRFVEFPIYNAIVAFLPLVLPQVFPVDMTHVYGRIVTAAFSLIIIAVLYYLGLKENNRATGFFAASTYAIFPFFVFFSRVVLPETTATAFAFLSIFLLYIYTLRLKSKPHVKFTWLMLSAVSFAAAVLVKPTAIFYGLALAFLFIRTHEFNVFKKWYIYLYGIVALLPFILWRMYISQYPEGIPASDWLFTHVNTYEGMKEIFFRPAFFRWIFLERINFMMLGGYVTAFFILGIIVKPKHYLLHSILVSAMVYLFTFQGGNVQHEYYQTVLLPAIALFVGVGAAFVINNASLFLHPVITYPAVLVTFALGFFFSFYRVKEFYHVPNDLVQIAKLIKTVSKPEDRIVTDRLGDTTLLYLADRKGAPATYKDASEFKNEGYKYIITANKELIQKLRDEKYAIPVENDHFAIIKL